MIDRELLLSEASKLNVSLNGAQLDLFDKLALGLTEKNRSMNLTAITEPRDIVLKHFADSLGVFAAVKVSEGCKFIDIGTGGGFPGLPMLIAREDLRGTLLDSTAKKLRFVDEMLNELNLAHRAVTLSARAEAAGREKSHREKYDLAVSRAVANLRVLSELCLPFVKVGGIFAALKSAKAEEEIEEAKKAVSLLGGEIDTVTEINTEDVGKRNIIVIRKTAPTPDKYPREYARIVKG